MNVIRCSFLSQEDYILNSNIMEFDKNLQNGEKELRNRRFIEEADAVKLARQVVISIMVDIYKKEHSDGNDSSEESGN